MHQNHEKSTPTFVAQLHFPVKYYSCKQAENHLVKIIRDLAQ